MKRRKSMQVTIETIIENAGRLDEYKLAKEAGDYFYLKAIVAGYMPLVIEALGNGEVSVAHYYEQNGDLMRDPEYVFSANWQPVEVTMDAVGLYKRADNGYRLNTGGFIDIWSRNLRHQGFTDNDVKFVS